MQFFFYPHELCLMFLITKYMQIILDLTRLNIKKYNWLNDLKYFIIFLKHFGYTFII